MNSNDSATMIQFLRPSGVLVALLVIAAAVVIQQAINRATTRMGKRYSEHRLLAQQINTILRFCVYVVAIVLVVSSVVSLEREALLAFGGVLAVVIGFALKDLAASVLAGLTILFDRPFQVGDRVTFGGQYGEITRIGLRSVRLVTLDDSTVTIPNNRFLTDVVVSGNAGNLDMQIVTDFWVALDTDIDVAKRIVYEAASTSRFVYLEKPVVVLVSDVVEANYLATRLRCKAYVLDIKYEMAFQTDVTERVKAAFREQDVRPPAMLHQPAAMAHAPSQ